MIAIIDYGMGNLRSVQKALERSGAKTIITQNTDEIKNADKLVLPGVGAMKPAMERLETLQIIPAIKESISSGKLFLGICLGFQLLFEQSSEGGNIQGLGILPGQVNRFKNIKTPHMGWNQLKLKQTPCPMFNGVPQNTDVYFCHSYFVETEKTEIIAAQTNYGRDFVSAVCRENILGVQFHPEKSQTMGLRILENFIQQ